MRAVVCDTQLKADTFSATIDTRLGYPKFGVDIGGGIHLPRNASRTLRHAGVFKHPTLSLWAYTDDEVGPRESIPLPPGASAQLLDSTWFPPAGP